ncbi:MAG TPA: [Fe-Fe] hydrogenase large subunit C-terminal domain-containing protein [Bacteroidales bacterium]|nr:[Fe-Fe] hydrogenase large subunit C-terminal domain-containing protein [Bacteroidales bacterium]
MGNLINNELVYTVKDRCRVCYTCVRECPVKAIKIINGQAEVISARCIGCGNCSKVCSQKAKVFIDTTAPVYEYLNNGQKTVALMAPSFAAEFSEIGDYKKLIGMLRKLGFDYVVEVGFGADIVSKEYKKLIDDKNSKKSISSDCPAIAYYVRHYHPDLIEYLAPIVSPMVAMVRVIKKKYGEDLKTVFIGPCIAKKAESNEVDQVITFIELRKMLSKSGITPDKVTPSDFDPPLAGKASIFPVTRGKLHSINKSDDICDENIIVASGRVHFREAIKEFDQELNKSQHLELLCCEGCIMGPGMTISGKMFKKTTDIRNYVRKKLENLDYTLWAKEYNEVKNLDFSQKFTPADRRIPAPSEEAVAEALIKLGKTSPQDHLNCGACGYDTCFEHATAIVEGYAETEMCLPYTIEKLHNSVKDLNLSNEKLANAQQSLKQSEKLANMGQLSAGIAHELNNPLGIITMYSNILKDEAPSDSPIQKDLILIAEQADRCKKIVGGLLNFARKNQVNLVETNVVNFTHHSLDSIIIPENITVDVQSMLTNPYAQIDTDQWMQVMTNIEKNAIEAMPDGGKLTITLAESNGDVEFSIADTGVGISKENLDKIFTPFFTTKPIGKGTGLGLPLIYGIVKMHNGQINLETNQDTSKGPTGTCFKIKIPRHKL